MYIDVRVLFWVLYIITGTVVLPVYRLNTKGVYKPLKKYTQWPSVFKTHIVSSKYSISDNILRVYTRCWPCWVCLYYAFPTKSYRPLDTEPDLESGNVTFLHM